MIFLVGFWDWFRDKADTWGPADLAMVIVAVGVAGFLWLAGFALLIWSMS